jgi:hypothetical protein
MAFSLIEGTRSKQTTFQKRWHGEREPEQGPRRCARPARHLFDSTPGLTRLLPGSPAGGPASPPWSEPPRRAQPRAGGVAGPPSRWTSPSGSRSTSTANLVRARDADGVRGARGIGGAGSVERAGGEHEARRSPRLGPAADVKTRSVQAVSGRCLHRGLGFRAVGKDPRHDRLGVSTCGHDRGPLDDGPAGGMSSGQASEQRANRVVVHAYHRSPYPGIGLCRTRNGSSVVVELTPRAGLQPRAREPPKRVGAEARSLGIMIETRGAGP